MCGYYGFNNAGDEAVLLALIQQIRRYLPGWEPVVLSADPDTTSRLYGVEAYHRWRWREVVREVRRCRALISGGGSLLQDVTGRASLLYYLGVIWLAKLFRKPVFIYCQGLGPLIHPESRLLVRLTLARLEGIVLRDEESAALLSSLGVNREVLVSADPVLSLDPSGADPAGAEELLNRLGLEPAKGPILLVNLRPLPGPLRAREAELERAARALVERFRARGWQPLLVPLHWPADREICCRVEPQAVLGEPLPLPILLGLFSRANLVVGVRLHALVFAALFGRPLVGLAYDPKVPALLRQIGGTALELTDLEPERLVAAATAAWEQRAQWQATLPQRLAPLRQRALAAPEYLRTRLEGNLRPSPTV
ncbi:MAG: polysaccharide pyruvyl transferase CsaB [Moorellales bacterium]